MANVFLSYSRADRPKAQQVAAALEEDGLTVWWDKVLKAGQTYDEVTEGMLRNADVVVVLWSTVSVKSKWVRAEATLGERYSTVIPAMIATADRPILFELTQTADLIGWDGDRSEQRWVDFVTDLRHAITRKAAHKAETVVAPKPAAVPVAPAPTPAAPVASPLAEDGTIENTFWTSIQTSTDTADFAAYLKRYPAGHYSDLARNRIAVLDTKAKAPEPVMVATPSSTAKAAKPKSSLVPMIAGGVTLMIGAGWGVSALMPSRDNGSAVAKAADTGESPPADAAVTEAADPGLAIPVDIAETADTAETISETVPGELEAEDAAPEGAAPEPAQTGPRPDCETCPVVASIPGGTFMMGSPDSESRRTGNEGPLHSVTVAPFVMSRSEITYENWDACLADGGCGGYRPGDTGKRGDMPVTSISWRDAQAYANWLSDKAGRTYRLPTEAEWEYAARGGTQTAYWWGDSFDRSKVSTGGPQASASLPENGFGLVGTLGNVREWVEDCYVNNFSTAPNDGRAVLNGSCDLRVIRGGAWSDNAATHRAANRARVSRGTRDRKIGFRVVSSDTAP
ncbi:SUMF1/EgtB/PvdO family nonheme iron enzyme [Hyphomonas sp.]|uniref:SUMF1/EgtB/PvdO family nonheme iron enzyme n=1 Tax=Hyphomonas sp. TaxID=87 RepID=UPI003563B25E